jgi:hypothetical protein
VNCWSIFAIHLADHASFWYSTEKYGEDALESADLYFAYGKALLENAISQASVLGKEQQEDDGEALDKKGTLVTLRGYPRILT